MAITARATVRNPWTIMAILNLGLFMTMLDMTIVNVAIPSIISGLRATLDQLLWVINGYSLVYAMLLIMSGRLGDILGPRNLFLAGTVVFAAASAGSGLSHSATELIAARAGQGVGAAMLAPQTLAYVAALFPPERRGSASGMTGGIAGIALVAGPTLGGFITTHFGWAWVFFLNLPISVVTVALTFLFVPDVRPGVRHRLDVLGVLLATAGIFGLVFGLIEGQRYNWGTLWSFVTIPEILGAGVAVLLVFLLTQYARRASEPLLPLAIFRQRNFTAMIVVIAAMGFAIIGIFLPFTIYLQSVLGLSAQDAGLTLAPTVIAIMVMAPVSGTLADRIGGKYLLVAGLLLFVVGMALIAQTESPTSDRWSFLPGLLVAGIGMGMTFAPLYSIALRTLDARFGGVASGVINTVQEVGSVIASAAVGALLQNRLATALHEQAVQRAPALPDAVRGRFVDAFNSAASGGLEVGRGETGTAVSLPPDVPPQVAHQILQLADTVFTNAYVSAMRPTLVLPMVIVALAAVTTLVVVRRPGPVEALAEEAREAA